MSKNELIKMTSKDITDYLYSKYGVEVDFLEIAEIININMRHTFKKVED